MFNEGGVEIKRLRKLSTVRCLGLRKRGGKTWIKRLLAEGLHQFLFPAPRHPLKNLKQWLLPIGNKSPDPNKMLQLTFNHALFFACLN